MADRLLYLPSLGLLACLVLAIYAAAEKPKFAMLAPVTLGLIVSAFALRTWIRNQDWQTELAMATPDKGGHRVKALGDVDAAIAQVKLGIAFAR